MVPAAVFYSSIVASHTSTTVFLNERLKFQTLKCTSVRRKNAEAVVAAGYKKPVLFLQVLPYLTYG
jgi:hypothetical protein